jgi:4-amino-4-deoxy-L-arabinose transferase-like glycosyltransferase
VPNESILSGTTATAAAAARPPLAARVVVALAAGFLIAHAATAANGAYGFHRDELLYLGMGQHLRLWRMDFPPGIALLAQALRHTIGDALVAVRLVPAVASSLVVLLAALIARELGGGRTAQALAALCVVANPLFMRAGALFQPVVLDQLAWTLGYWSLARWRRTSDPRWWLGIGGAAGLGLLCKFSVAFFGLGVLVAVLLLPERRVLRTRWPWLGAMLALVIGAPSLTGQLLLHAPVVGQMRELQASQLTHTGPADFLTGQLLMGPGVLLALAGVVALVGGQALARWRSLGVACLTSFVTLLALHGKPYYAGPVFPALFAAGAVWLELGLAGARPAVRRASLGGASLLLAAYGLAVLPFGLPILPPAPMARYANAMGLTAAVTTNMGTVLPLPQDYADMLGWEAQVRTLAGVYRALPAADRARTVLAAANYGEAGAIDYYAPRYGLPGAISSAGSYWFFGPGALPGDVVLVVGGHAGVRADLDHLFARCEAAARVENAWAVPEEQHIVVWRCDEPRRPLQVVWPELAGQN